MHANVIKHLPGCCFEIFKTDGHMVCLQASPHPETVLPTLHYSAAGVSELLHVAAAATKLRHLATAQRQNDSKQRQPHHL